MSPPLRCRRLSARRRSARARPVLAGLIALLAAAAGLPASADTMEMRRLRCATDGTDQDMRIAACSALIGAPGEGAANRSTAFYNRGNAWREKGAADAALADYTEAIRLNRGYANAFNNRGIVRHARGELAQAMADFDEAIRLNPRHVHAFHNRGNAWRYLGDTPRALADYSAAIRLDPREPLALASRCLLRVQRGEGRPVLADCDAGVAAMRPLRPWPLQARAAALLLLEDRGGADRDIEAALRQAPGDGWLLWLRALLRHQRGQEEAARRDLAAAAPVAAQARRLFGPLPGAGVLLNGARPEGRIEPGWELALPAALLCDRPEIAGLLAAAPRTARREDVPPGCLRADILFREAIPLPTPRFEAMVVPAEAHATRACERLSLRQEPCPLALRPVLLVQGLALRPGAEAWVPGYVILDARLAGARPGAGAPAAPAPSVMDAPPRGGYEVDLADRRPPWPLPPLTTPPNGTGMPR